MTEQTEMPTDARQQYFSAPGLSHSAMRDLAISPLRFWYYWVNPDAPLVEPTAEQQFGSAVHCAVLEPDEFDKRYAREVEVPEGCLDTIEELRAFIRDCGHQPKGTRKADVIAQVQTINPSIPILQVLEERHATATAGKVVFDADTWQRINGAASSLIEEPVVRGLLTYGEAEKKYFAADAETNVSLKGMMDWVLPSKTVDLKTFKAPRGKSIDKAVADAIYYEGYYRQAYFYTLLRSICGEKDTDFYLVFVESEPPFETRIKLLRPTLGGNVNLYWETARIWCRDMIRSYAHCLKQFGDKPWRYQQAATPLADEELKALAFD